MRISDWSSDVCSSDLTVVTALDAYIKPVVDRYIANLKDGLKTGGVTSSLQIMQSRGGIARSEAAKRRPVRLFLTGPEAGGLGAQHTGALDGLSALIGVQTRGTTSGISLIRAGRPPHRAE